MRIYYLSTSSFFQADKEIVDKLAKKNQLHLGMVVGKSRNNFSDADLNEYCRVNEIEHTIWKLNYRHRDVRLATVFSKIVKQINSFKPDVIYIVSFDHPVFSLLSLRLNKYKVIVALHDVVFHSKTKNAALHTLARKLTMARFKNYQVFSDGQARLFKERYPDRKLFTIPLPLSSYGNSTPSPQKSNRTRFLFFGKILPYKGLDILIQAANKLVAESIDFELVIAGQCDHWDAVYQPLLSNAANNIELRIRYIDNEEISELFSSVHYLVLPYTDATQSGPLMIAFNYSVPIIASKIEAFEEFVKEGISGYLFNRASNEELVSVLKKAALASAAEYNNLVENMKKYVTDNFSNDALEKKYEKMFQTVLNEAANMA